AIGLRRERHAVRDAHDLAARLEVRQELLVERRVRRRRERARSQLLDEGARPRLGLRTESRLVVCKRDGGAGLLRDPGAGPVSEQLVENARREAQAAAELLLRQDR